MAKRAVADILAAQDQDVDGAIQLGPLGGYIGFHLRLAQDAAFQAFARRTGQTGLKPGRFAILMLIHTNPGITQVAVSRAAGRDKSTLTPALRDLVARGFVERRRIATDRRSYTLTLTPAGEAVLRELRRHAEAHDRDLDRIIGLENKAEFLRNLRRIIMALGDSAPSGPES